MNEIILFRKGESNVYEQSVVESVFKSSSDISEISEYVKKAKDRIYLTWAHVEAVDKANEKIPAHELIEEQETFVKERGGTITDSHSNTICGKTLDYKVMTHPVTKTKGILYLNKIYSNYPTDDVVWKETQEGKRQGTSVGGGNTSYEYEQQDDGSLIKVLTGVYQYENANCETPCNPYAVNEAVSQIAKSEKMAEKEQIKKEEEVMVSEENQQSEETMMEALNTLKDAISTIATRMDEMEDRMESMNKGEDDMEKEEESEEEMEKEEEDESKEDMEKEADEEEKKEDKYEKLLKEFQDLKKSVEEKKEAPAKVAKGSRGTPTEKVEKSEQSNLALQVALGKMDFNNALEKFEGGNM